MEDSPHSQRHRISFIAAGIVQIAVAGTVDVALGQAFALGQVQLLGMAVGLLLIIIGVIPPGHSFRAHLATPCLLLLTALLAVVVAEYICHFTRVDFDQQHAKEALLPPSARLPRTPSGDGFYRRQAELTWHGKPLQAIAESQDLPITPYAREKAISLRYDAHGFRNADNLTDWEIAIAGGGNVELGHLPHDQLFTTILDRRIGRPVKNLGTASTGPLTALHHLKTNGVSASTRHLILVFAEGHDPQLLLAETKRPTDLASIADREIVPQSSLLQHIRHRLLHHTRQLPSYTPSIDAWYTPPDLPRLPITLDEHPPTHTDLQDQTSTAINQLLDAYAELAASYHQTPWLLFIPCKHRLSDDKLFALQPSTLPWQTNEFPARLADACAARHIKFVNPTRILRQYQDQNHQLVHNPLGDPHLSAEGSKTVGKYLAQALWYPVTGLAPLSEPPPVAP